MAIPPAATLDRPIHDCNAASQHADAELGSGDHVVNIEPRRGVEHYQRALAIYPKHPSALWKLALAYQQQRDWTQMSATLEQAVELEPSYTPFWHRLGYARVLQARAGDRAAYERAIVPLKRCIEDDPNIADCYFLLGESYEFTGDDHAALIAYTQAIEHEPSQASYYPTLAHLYLALHLLDQAEGVLAEAVRVIALDARNASALYTVYIEQASIAEAKGDLAAMERALDEAQKCDTSNPLQDLYLAKVFARGRPSEKDSAIRLLHKFQGRACPGPGASRFKKECDEANALLHSLGAP